MSRHFALVVVVSLGLPLAAQSSLQAQTPFQGEGGKVRVLSFPSGNDYPYWTISKLGLDRKYGFQLENVPSQPGGAVATAFRSAAVDGGSMNWLELARLRTNGDSVTAVAPFLQMPNVYIVPTNSSIKDMADLKGKVIGTYFRFAPEWILYAATAKAKANYDPRTDSTIHEAGPGLLRGLLEQKQLQASFIFYNLAFPMIASGDYRILFASRDLLPAFGLSKELMLSTTSFREQYIKSNPKNVKAFALAYQEAVRYLASNDDVWIEMLARQEIKDPKVVALMRDWSRTVLLERFSDTVREDTQKIFDTLYQVGGKEAMGVDKLPDGIVDTSFTK
jgi:NitT/TauT family transport system substrate-binding protein